ncbi:S-layer homology domain-containing protein [Paenibacillus tuaregi]|uniref:S-layer homology domain-containing protein n=1 Tax=Paenibacillus tuaregi TaxID=1816681 RepID=UPI0009EF1BB0
MEAVRKLSIVNGRGDNKFVPNGTASRAEAGEIFSRINGSLLPLTWGGAAIFEVSIFNRCPNKTQYC